MFWSRKVEKDQEEFLFITIDSLRYDTYVKVSTPNLDKVGSVNKAYSYAPYTYASHAAMFVGFTPGDPSKKESFINPKYGKIFRMSSGGGFKKATDYIALEGRNIIDGFNRLGYDTIGTGSVGWFDPKTETSSILHSDFKKYAYYGLHTLEQQIDFITTEVKKAKRPKFVFLNVSETHVPYYFNGASWDRHENTCIPFSEDNSKEKSMERQKLSLEYIDEKLKPILESFSGANIIVAGDHGDVWGEDDLWEHGIFHPKAFEVPLIYKLLSK